jgi:hypothetical protein
MDAKHDFDSGDPRPNAAAGAAIGKRYRTGSSGENIKMLRENSGLFPTCREPVRSAVQGHCLKWLRASAAKNHKTAEKLATLSPRCFRNPCGRLSILRTRTAQVRRLGGGPNAESLERNEPREENRRANLLYRSSIAQVPPPPRSAPQSKSAQRCLSGKKS